MGVLYVSTKIFYIKFLQKFYEIFWVLIHSVMSDSLRHHEL